MVVCEDRAPVSIVFSLQLNGQMCALCHSKPTARTRPRRACGSVQRIGIVPDSPSSLQLCFEAVYFAQNAAMNTVLSFSKVTSQVASGSGGRFIILVTFFVSLTLYTYSIDYK